MTGRRFIIFPYQIYSQTSRDLARVLREKLNGNTVLRVFPNGRYRSRTSDFIVNWGNSKHPEWEYTDILNKPEAVSLAVNKIKTFQTLQEAEVRTVPFTTDLNEAREWDLICERHVLTGHSGAGIRVSTPDQLTPAPLYTKMLLPSEEYRVHIFRGEVIDYAKKFKRGEDGEIIFLSDDPIKNRSTGWEFMRDVSGHREGVIKRATEAVEALGLDFGAVDVIRHKNKSYVLEVGTACGLSDRGLEAYANKIIEHATQR